MASFVKQLGAPGALENVLHGDAELGVLPPFLRVLLTSDGTVTNSLEAFFWEPVSVRLVQQREQSLHADAPYLERAKGEPIAVRDVQLLGENSHTIYCNARSLICFDLLSESFQRDLHDQRLGVGELLRDCGLETYREILEIGCDEEKDEVWRIYRIVMGQRPFIQISERFPMAVYA